MKSVVVLLNNGGYEGWTCLYHWQKNQPVCSSSNGGILFSFGIVTFGPLYTNLWETIMIYSLTVTSKNVLLCSSCMLKEWLFLAWINWHNYVVERGIKKRCSMNISCVNVDIKSLKTDYLIFQIMDKRKLFGFIKIKSRILIDHKFHFWCIICLIRILLIDFKVLLVYDIFYSCHHISLHNF